MTTSALDVLPYLVDAGLEEARQEDEEVHARCPAHEERAGKPDRNPSFWFNPAKGIGFCFSCGWKASFHDLVVRLTGRAPDGDLMLDITEASVIKKLTEAKREHFVDDINVHQWTLDVRFRDVPERLMAIRRLKTKAVAFFGVRFDPEHRCWVLPIRTPSGELLGWQQRQKGAISTYPKGIKKSVTLFGASEMLQHETLVLVESPLDVVRLWQCGIPAVSSMGAYVSNDQVTLLARNCETVVMALDNDVTGRQQSQRIGPFLRRRGAAVIDWRYDGRYKDPGDYESDEDLIAAWKSTLRFGLS